MMFYISQDKQKIQANDVQGLLAQSYWANKRSVDTIQKTIENSLCFGAYSKESDELIGFARVITDFATTYYICDVIVNDHYRGLGIGKALMKTITNDERLNPLLGMLLTSDAHGLYEQYGFCRDGNKFMSKMRPS